MTSFYYRCQHMLQQRDGPRWREKLKPLKVNPTEIPEVIGVDGKPTVSVSFNNPSFTSQSQPSSGQSSSQSQNTSASKSQSEQSKKSSSQSTSSIGTSTSQPQKKKEELTLQQQFEKYKAEGNEFVKQVHICSYSVLSIYKQFDLDLSFCSAC